MVKWIELNELRQLDKVLSDSHLKPVVLFKHSTRCSVSRASLKYFEMDAEKVNTNLYDFYFLDLLNHRDISDKIASLFDVRHESPQMLLIKNGKCVMHRSHSEIAITELANN